MLDRRITKEGVLVFQQGRILIDGWETNAPCQNRELGILACLCVARHLMDEAIEELKEAGAGRTSIGVPECHARPSSFTLSLADIDHAFSPWYRALKSNDAEGYDSALRYTDHLVTTHRLSRESAAEIEARMVMLACEVGGFNPFPDRTAGKEPVQR